MIEKIQVFNAYFPRLSIQCFIGFSLLLFCLCISGNNNFRVFIHVWMSCTRLYLHFMMRVAFLSLSQSLLHVSIRFVLTVQLFVV